MHLRGIGNAERNGSANIRGAYQITVISSVKVCVCVCVFVFVCVLM